jgi:prolyl oligopeptidase
MHYPTVARDETVVETLHDRVVADPYRALEDPDAAETAAFCLEQNKVTSEYLQEASSFRTKVKADLEAAMDYDKYGVMFKQGDRWYYHHHAGLQNQGVMYQSTTVDAKDARVFLDPNLLSEDGTASLGQMQFSENGEYCAYCVQRSGSDWADIYLMQTESLEKLDDHLEWAKFCSIAWTHDNAGFYYSRYPAPESLKDGDEGQKGRETDESLDQAVYYHKIGDPQEKDSLVIPANPLHRKYMYGLQMTADGQYLMVTVAEDCAPQNLWWYVDVTAHFGEEADNLVRLINVQEASFSYIANDDTLFYFKTNLDASNSKILNIDLTSPERENWKDVVPHHKKNVLSSAIAVNGSQLALVYMENASDHLYVHTLKSGAFEKVLPLPDLGEVQVWGRRRFSELTFKFSSFLYPGTVFYCDLTMPVGDGLRVFRQMAPPGFEPSKYKTEQVWFKSKDGTSVPMFVIGSAAGHEVANAPKRPVLLYGYGGFSISLTPFFSMRFISWLESMGGVVAVANLRGGAEFGKAWHDAGILGNKQCVFDDMQHAAKELIDRGIAIPSKLCIMGGSNGGLLVTACANQAPQLFAAVVSQVAVTDMLRFHRCDSTNRQRC